jgi:hypothetical protein
VRDFASARPIPVPPKLLYWCSPELTLKNVLNILSSWFAGIPIPSSTTLTEKNCLPSSPFSALLVFFFVF